MAGEAEASSADAVGPVLSSGRIGSAIVRAIQEENPAAQVTDRGSYLRVLVPRRCRVTRAAIEAALSESFRLPGDLELVMPSFRGRFFVSEDQACWSVGPPPEKRAEGQAEERAEER